MTIEELKMFYKQVRDNEQRIQELNSMIEPMLSELYDLNIAVMDNGSKKERKELSIESDKLKYLERELNNIKAYNIGLSAEITKFYYARIRYNKEYKNVLCYALKRVINEYFKKDFIWCNNENEYYLKDNEEYIKLPLNNIDNDFVEYVITNSIESPWDLFVSIDGLENESIGKIMSDFLIYLFIEKYRHQVLYITKEQMDEVIDSFLRKKLEKTSLQRERNLLK